MPPEGCLPPAAARGRIAIGQARRGRRRVGSPLVLPETRTESRARGSHDKHGAPEKMTKPTIGVDISKDHLDACRWPGGETCRVTNDAKGHRQLIRWIGTGVACVAFEATGAYHAALEKALHRADVPASKLHPARVRRFAEAPGTHAKTDRIDARLIARMTAMIEPRPDRPKPAVLAELHELQLARAALNRECTAATNRGGRLTLALLKRQHAPPPADRARARPGRHRDRRPRRLGPGPGAQGRDPLLHSRRLDGHRRGRPRRAARARPPRGGRAASPASRPSPGNPASGRARRRSAADAATCAGRSTFQPSRRRASIRTSRPSTTVSAPGASLPSSPSSP